MATAMKTKSAKKLSKSDGPALKVRTPADDYPHIVPTKGVFTARNLMFAEYSIGDDSGSGQIFEVGVWREVVRIRKDSRDHELIDIAHDKFIELLKWGREVYLPLFELENK